MPFTEEETIWLDTIAAAADDPDVPTEGISMRVVEYLLRQVVSSRDEIAALTLRVIELEKKPKDPIPPEPPPEPPI